MSYEGFVVRLCENGHLAVFDCWEADEVSACADCGAPPTWWQAVDETNGYDANTDPRYNGTLVQVVAPRTERCNLGHEHILEPARYIEVVLPRQGRPDGTGANAMAPPPGSALPARLRALEQAYQQYLQADVAGNVETLDELEDPTRRLIEAAVDAAAALQGPETAPPDVEAVGQRLRDYADGVDAGYLAAKAELKAAADAPSPVKGPETAPPEPADERDIHTGDDALLDALTGARAPLENLLEGEHGHLTPDQFQAVEDAVCELTTADQLRVAELQAADAPSPAPHGWQPIETAPKDGTEILVFDEGAIMVSVWLDDDGRGNAGWWDNGIMAPPPSHWHALPAPPPAPDRQEER